MADIKYGLTKKGRMIEPKPTPAGKVLEFIQESDLRGHQTSFNPDEVNYQLQISDAAVIMDSLQRAGFLWKETKDDTAEPKGDLEWQMFGRSTYGGVGMKGD